MIERLSSTTSISYNSDIMKKASSQVKTDIQGSKEEKPLNKEQVEEVVKSLNDFVQPIQTSIQFELHEESQEYYVKVVDISTKETIREIPSKKLLDIYTAMTQFLGLMFDRKI